MDSLTDQLIAFECQSSLFENAIRQMETPIAPIFKQSGEIRPVVFSHLGHVIASPDADQVAKHFPKIHEKSKNQILRGDRPRTEEVSKKRVAVLFSGGPASGGHNIIVGLGLALGRGHTLLGVKAGPKGLIEGDLFEIDEQQLSRIKNTGGFDFLGSDRTKIKKPEQLAAVKQTCENHKLDAIVIVGGDDSNTNAAILAEQLDEIGVQVIGVPKTIDGDLQAGEYLPISFGFDTASKTYAEMVGNILQDTPSSRKYWHFIKVMGRSASHIALEVALQTHPAVCLISEEVKEKQWTLNEIIDQVCTIIEKRAKKGIHHGVVVIPEGLIEFIPNMDELIEALNESVGKVESVETEAKDKEKAVLALLPQNQRLLFQSLPEYIRSMLLADRDSHGNLQVSLIPTERLLMDMVRTKLKERAFEVSFSAHSHFFGYEGRCGAPSLFDAAYCLNLGLTAGSIVLSGLSGYMASMTSMTNMVSGGEVLAIPLTGLINLERRHGENVMVIKKALVELDSPAFKYFESRRGLWASQDLFCSPGPRQLWGPVSNQLPISVALNQCYSSLQFQIE